MTDSTNACNECGQLRSISNTEDGSEIQAINSNFEMLNANIQNVKEIVDGLVDQDGNLDLQGKCITNLGDCCKDPKSIVTAEYLNNVVRVIVAKLVVDMVTDPEKYLKYSGVKFYSSNRDKAVEKF